MSRRPGGAEADVVSKGQVSSSATIGLAVIALVWIGGAIWSFYDQQHFAEELGFIGPVLPLVVDGLPIGLGLIALDTSLEGETALGVRLGMALAVCLSLGSNGLYAWWHSHDGTTVVVAVAPVLVSAIAFELALGAIRKRIKRRRGDLPTRAPRQRIPELRLIRVALDPFHELSQWRRTVLAATNPAADPATREALARLVATGRLLAPGPAEAAEEAAAPELYAAPRILAAGEHDDASHDDGGEETAPREPRRRTTQPRRETTTRRTTTPRAVSSRRDSSTGSRPAVSHDGEAPRSAAGSQRALMAGWAHSQLDAGVELRPVDLDRQFGTNNYGSKVLAEVRAQRAQRAEPAAIAPPVPMVPAQPAAPAELAEVAHA